MYNVLMDLASVFGYAEMRSPEVGDAQVSLLAVAQVRLGDEDVPHGQHAQPANLFGRVENDRREPRGHL